MASLSHSSADYADFSCIPSIMPHGMDPSLPDFREFYPYIPNEVKHRKRTTQAQLEVLEDTFGRDKKPNGILRSDLARELGMTPRGVQVWFQNRRAKEKTLAKKAVAAKRKNNSNGSGNPKLPTTPEAAPEGRNIVDPFPQSRKFEDRKDSRPTPISSAHQSDKGESAQAPALSHSVPSTESSVPSDDRSRLFLFDSEAAIARRRPSLPVLTSKYSEPHKHRPQLNSDHLIRRSSVDTNIHRLASHPYAHLAAQVNVTHHEGKGFVPRLYGVKSNSLPGFAADHFYPQSPGFSSRQPPSHRASMPYLFAHDSVAEDQGDAIFVHASSRYHHGAYTMSRVISGPIPGPLPLPNFSFGDSSAAPSPSESDSSDQIAAALNGYAFPAMPDRDTEDDATNSSFDAFSRFGSIASLADSESSATSTLYSEASSCVSERQESDFKADSRRPSHASGHMLGLDLFSTISLENQAAQPVARPYSTQDNVNGSPNDLGSPDNEDGSSGATTTYPSPVSTASGESNSTKGQVRISLSSELALALSPAAVAEVAGAQDVPDTSTDETRVGNCDHMNTQTNDSSPVLDPSGLLAGGRACYDPNYAGQSYPIYENHSRFDLVSKQGRYVGPSYGENPPL